MKTKTAGASRSLSCHLVFRDSTAALDFYVRAFDAHELYRLVEPSGKIGHAEMRIGDSTFMLADEYPDFGALSPASIGGSPVKFLIHVENADAAMKQAVAAGATEVRSVKDEFHGNRTGMVMDPFGYSWSLSQEVESLSPEEMQKRFSAMFAA